MIVADRMIVAPNMSSAWADALSLLLKDPSHRVVNLTLRIADPLAEDDSMRSFADRMLGGLGLRDIHEVANTIFPAEWAMDIPDPEALGADYREHYPLLKALGSPQGTYFGRLVAYPDHGATIDQLHSNISKLRNATGRGRVYKSVYEFNIFSAAHDQKKPRGFPCLAHFGVHIGVDGRLNGSALYRSHDVVEKGYGNYLGLGGLLGYIAEATGLEAGELQVVAGGAFFGAPISKVRRYRPELESLRSATLQ